MFQITAATCRAFTFGEVLIMAAMNIESVRLGSEGRFRANGAAAHSKYARHVVRTGVPTAQQL
ncbi:MAG: hypothetical protein ACLPW4_08965 [Candidatus Sulfotelmatobacter sp.]